MKKRASSKATYAAISLLIFSLTMLLFTSYLANLLFPHLNSFFIVLSNGTQTASLASTNNGLIGIFSGLVAASVAALIIERLSRSEINSFMESTFSDSVGRMNNIAAPLANAGATGFSFSRDMVSLFNILEDSEHFFWSIGTSLPDVTSYPFYERLCEKIIDAHESNNTYNVRFAILNPFSYLSLRKSSIQAYDGQSFQVSDLIKNTLSNVKIARAKLTPLGLQKSIEVRLHNTIPTVSCVLSEKKMNISFYDEITHGNRAPAWTVEPNSIGGQEGKLYHHYRTNFEAIWNRSDHIDLFSGNVNKRVEKELDAMEAAIESIRKSLEPDFFNI